MFAIADSGPFAVLTIADSSRLVPTWKTMFGWPADDPRSLALSVRSRAERKIWAARLDQAVCATQRPVLLVADGLGCAASAWWGRLSPADYVSRVAGALLFAPRGEDTAVEGDPGLFASPGTLLPFPSVVIQPQHDAAAIRTTVEGWGSQLVAGRRARSVVAERGAWQQAQRLFLRVTKQVVAHEVARAEALIGRR